MKMLTGVKAMLAAAMAAVGLAVFAVPSVEITSVRLRDPRDGTVEYRYKVDGEFEEGEYDVLIKVSVANGTKSTVVTHESVAGGRTVSTNLNVQTLFGKAYPNVTLFAELKKAHAGVQLWEGGPFWAECNVGAENPEDPGYYFWWGDTVGYVRNAGDTGWVSVDGKGTSIEFKRADPVASQNCNHDKAWLEKNDWIDANGHLLLKHDAARKHLGGNWRLPTHAEIYALCRENRCDLEWTTQNGVKGCLVKGKGSFSGKRIFLPVAGVGSGNTHLDKGTHGRFWTSEPNKDSTFSAMILGMDWSNKFLLDYNNVDRCCGQSIRAVRDAE